MRDFETGLTQNRLKELLHYDPETGLFTWKVTRGAAFTGMVITRAGINGYLSATVDGFRYYCHRLAWLYMTGTLPEHEVDHEDTDRTNNRWRNLRPADDQQNSANARLQKNNTSGFKGVYWHKQRGRWAAGISVKRKHIHLGCFDDPAKAHAAYLVAAVHHFGDFARSA